MVSIQAWALRRMISVYNLVTRRPHVPREKALRRILINQGFDIELETPPRPGPRAGSSGGHDDDPMDSCEECEESEEFSDDESICPHPIEYVEPSGDLSFKESFSIALQQVCATKPCILQDYAEFVLWSSILGSTGFDDSHRTTGAIKTDEPKPVLASNMRLVSSPLSTN